MQSEAKELFRCTVAKAHEQYYDVYIAHRALRKLKDLGMKSEANALYAAIATGIDWDPPDFESLDSEFGMKHS
jgi:hypothetical protein